MGGYRVSFGPVTIAIETEEGLFSPRHADRGTLAMLAQQPVRPGDRVLDLGCGAGLVGIWAEKAAGAEEVWMVDIDPRAVETARANAALNGATRARFAVSDGLDGVDAAGFDVILCNPPYQSDFAVAKKFIEKGFNRLAVGGRMWMVTRRCDWYRNKLRAVFGGVKVTQSDGYWVFMAERRTLHYANTKKYGR